MKEDWDKIINIVDRTGDKVIFFTEGKSYVIMPLRQYEALLQVDKGSSLSENDLIDKINKDIAMWKAQTAVEKEKGLAESVALEQSQEEEKAVEEDEGDDEFHIEPVNI